MNKNYFTLQNIGNITIIFGNLVIILSNLFFYKIVIISKILINGLQNNVINN